MSLCRVLWGRNSSRANAGNTKGGSITVLLTSSLTGLDMSVLWIKTKIVSCHTADSKPVKQEVNGTVILLPFVFPDQGYKTLFVRNLLIFIISESAISWQAFPAYSNKYCRLVLKFVNYGQKGFITRAPRHNYPLFK